MMKPYFEHKLVTLYYGNCLDILPSLSGGSAIVTDPPYGLEFMGKGWDAPWKANRQVGGGFSKPGIGARETPWPSFSATSRFGATNPTCVKCGGRARGAKKCICEVPEWKPIGKRRNPENEGLPDDMTGKGMAKQMQTLQEWHYQWAIVARHAVIPGAPLLSFGGTRTFHRLACAIENAGWAIRDTLMWVYGSGFPKSLDISLALDRKACLEELVKELGRSPTKEEFKARWSEFRTEIVGQRHRNVKPYDDDKGWNDNKTTGDFEYKAPATPEAQLWEGYGTALKPAYEPIILAMNPLDGTFANNALKYGVAGLNIDECRIEGEKGNGVWGTSNKTINIDRKFNASPDMTEYRSEQHPRGRFPANFLHDGSQMVMELFPKQAGAGGQASGKTARTWGSRGIYGGANGDGKLSPFYGDNGSAARFFYCAKASKAERNRGCEGLEPKQPDPSRKEGNPGGDNPRNRGVHKVLNNHPTVKPLALMEYLCRLVKMPGYNLIIDPFCGSASTLLACIKLGIPCIGIDNDEATCEIAARRCSQEVKELV